MTLKSSDTAVIAISTSLSAAVLVPAGFTLAGIIMPTAWTAANLTFQGSANGTLYNDIYNAAGTEYNVTASTSRFITIDPPDFAGVGWIKVRSGTTGTPVTQTAARSIVLVFREVE